jgi:hypothetical protein
VFFLPLKKTNNGHCPSLVDEGETPCCANKN